MMPDAPDGLIADIEDWTMRNAVIPGIPGTSALTRALLEPAWALSLILTLVAFLIDATTPHGVADGFLYVLPVLACFWVPGVNAALYAAMALMVPLGLGMLISPVGAPIWIEVTNRLLGAATIWLTALLISHNARVTAQREQLLGRVRELNHAAERLKYGTQVSLSRWLDAGLSRDLCAVGGGLDRIADDQPGEQQVRVIASEARDIIDAAIVAVHDEEDRLRVPVEPLELEWFVRQHITDFRSQTGIPVTVRGAVDLSVAQEIRAALCSDIVREALDNIAKHADANRVTLEFREDSLSAHITIEDDGRGIVPDKQVGWRGLGLLRLQERLKGIGGALLVSNVTPHGARVQAWVPRATQVSP
jgi:signal transduction histidine kinase